LKQRARKGISEPEGKMSTSNALAAWLAFFAFMASLIMVIVNNAPHRQKRLSDNGESDRFIDAFVWLNRQIYRRSR
jgi:hypothetical protein